MPVRALLERCEFCRWWAPVISRPTDMRCKRPQWVLEMIPVPPWFGCSGYDPLTDEPGREQDRRKLARLLRYREAHRVRQRRRRARKRLTTAEPFGNIVRQREERDDDDAG